MSALAAAREVYCVTVATSHVDRVTRFYAMIEFGRALSL
jgi:hypothetical protein